MLSKSIYLEIAEEVLVRAGLPLTAAEILVEAKENGLIPSHLYGSRQDRTLQARLSEDIVKRGVESRFFRTGPGKFFLRVLDGGEHTYGEYFARPRRKELPANEILTLDVDIDSCTNFDGKRIELDQFLEILRSGSYRYRHYKAIQDEERVSIVNSFLLVSNNGRVLSFRCGKFYPEDDPLFGKRTIGLGGVVLFRHMDFLYNSMYGIAGSAVEDLVAGIGLPRRLAELARYEELLKPVFALKVEKADKKKRIVHLVMSYECPTEFVPEKKALSVNDIKWLTPPYLPNDIDDYDETSQYLMKNGSLNKILAPVQV